MNEQSEDLVRQLSFSFVEDTTRSAPRHQQQGPCLRYVPAMIWSHIGCARDRDTIAVMCGCEKCIRMLHPVVDFTAFRKRKKP